MIKLGLERFSIAERRDREMFSALSAGPERFSTAERRVRTPLSRAAKSVFRSHPAPEPQAANIGWRSQAFISSH
jgi:hypothetical protein